MRHRKWLVSVAVVGLAIGIAPTARADEGERGKSSGTRVAIPVSASADGPVQFDADKLQAELEKVEGVADARISEKGDVTVRVLRGKRVLHSALVNVVRACVQAKWRPHPFPRFEALVPMTRKVELHLVEGMSKPGGPVSKFADADIEKIECALKELGEVTRAAPPADGLGPVYVVEFRDPQSLGFASVDEAIWRLFTESRGEGVQPSALLDVAYLGLSEAEEEWPGYQPKETPDTVLDYCGSLGEELEKLPPEKLGSLPDLVKALEEMKARAAKNPGTYRPGDGALGDPPEVYEPSAEELLVSELGERIRRVVEANPKEEVEKVLDAAQCAATEVKYGLFSFSHVDAMGTGRFFYAFGPTPTEVKLRGR